MWTRKIIIAAKNQPASGFLGVARDKPIKLMGAAIRKGSHGPRIGSEARERALAGLSFN